MYYYYSKKKARGKMTSLPVMWENRMHDNKYHILLTHTIRVITKLPNSEQSYKGKVKTHNYINRQNQSTTGKLWKP
jgi:hypothetical protein